MGVILKVPRKRETRASQNVLSDITWVNWPKVEVGIWLFCVVVVSRGNETVGVVAAAENSSWYECRNVSRGVICQLIFQKIRSASRSPGKRGSAPG